MSFYTLHPGEDESMFVHCVDGLNKPQTQVQYAVSSAGSQNS